MEWIDVDQELPKFRQRFLAKCMNDTWEGIVDVYFDPHFGWCRCESYDKRPVYVTHYTKHPIPDIDKKKFLPQANKP